MEAFKDKQRTNRLFTRGKINRPPITSHVFTPNSIMLLFPCRRWGGSWSLSSHVRLLDWNNQVGTAHMCRPPFWGPHEEAATIIPTPKRTPTANLNDHRGVTLKYRVSQAGAEQTTWPWIQKWIKSNDSGLQQVMWGRAAPSLHKHGWELYEFLGIHTLEDLPWAPSKTETSRIALQWRCVFPGSLEETGRTESWQWHSTGCLLYY